MSKCFSLAWGTQSPTPDKAKISSILWNGPCFGTYGYGPRSLCHYKKSSLCRGGSYTRSDVSWPGSSS